MKPIVLLDAAPFCYGPISTLQAVVDHLLHSDLRLVMLVSGTSAEFMRGYDRRCELVHCQTETLSDLERHADLFRECAVFVSNTNPPSAVFAQKMGCQIVYIDTLFWMWDHIDPELNDAAIYFAQEFDGLERNWERIGRGIRNYRPIGPLVSDPPAPRLPRMNQCLISFGGIESKFNVAGVTNRYPWTIANILIELLSDSPFEKILVRGGVRVMEELKRETKDPRFEFGFAPHDKFLEEVASSRAYFMSPGLTGAYEAMQAGTPTCLLLPQNYSQVLQANTFLSDERYPFFGWTWHDIYDDYAVNTYEDEETAIRRLNETIHRFERDKSAKARYLELLNGWDWDIAGQRQLARNVLSAAEDVARVIEEYASAQVVE